MRIAPDAAVSLGLLLAINLFNYIDRSVLAAVQPLIQDELLKGDPNGGSKMGLLTSAFMVAYMLTSPVFGALGDRYRRWALVGAGVIAWSLASGASGLAATFGIMLVTRMFVGVGEAAYGPTAPTIIADLYPVSKRGGVLAWFYVAIPVGTALGFVLGGFLAHHFGWRWAFYAVVPPGVLLGVLCFFRREPPRGESDAGGSGGTTVRRRITLADAKALFRTPSYVFNTAGMTAMTFALGGLAAWVVRYVSHERGAGEIDAVNWTFGIIVVVAGLVGTLSGGYIADALRKRWSGAYFLVAGVGMLLGFPCFLATLYVPFPYAWGTMFVAVVCLMLNTGPTNTIIANVTQPGLRSSAFAVNILIIHALGDVISPPLIGWVYDLTGNLQSGFLLVGGAFLVSGVFWMLGATHLERDTRRASEHAAPPTA